MSASQVAAERPLAGQGAGMSAFGRYLQFSEQPLTSLLFVLPLIVFYELGSIYLINADPSQAEIRIVAFTLMRRFFALFGASGKFLPGLAVVAILLSWHMARHDQWRLRLGTTAAMAAESALLGWPLLVIARVFGKGFVLHSEQISYNGMFVLSVGAGVYEELVFRLAGFALLSFLLVDVLKMQKQGATILIVFLTAILFSAYHYMGVEGFRWESFVFRTLVGLYFGVVFLVRGFGVTVGTHAAYDIIATVLILRAAG